MTTTPVIILSGFLGSGKTTLLLRLLEEAQRRGLRAGVLMNELGRQDVDGKMVEEAAGASLERLLDGCICCSKKSEVAGSIRLLLDRQPDFLLVELTGVANPEEVADALTEPGLVGKVALMRIITVLDAEHVLEYNSIFSSDRSLIHTLRRQIEAADCILVNKTDLVDQGKLLKIEKAVRKQNPLAPVSYTTNSQADCGLLLDGVTSRTTQSPDRGDAHAHVGTGDSHKARKPAFAMLPHRHTPSFSRIRTFTLFTSGQETLPEDKLKKFLLSWGNRLLRAKGYLPDQGRAGRRLMQFAGKRLEWSASGYSGEPYLVLIVMDAALEEVQAQWDAFMPGVILKRME